MLSTQQKECRICFSQQNPENMVSPCDCKGTSAYIHIECLENYFHHFPDRVCRVCHQHMYYTTSFDKAMFFILVFWLATLAMLSNSPIIFKMSFIFLLVSVSMMKPLRNVLNAYVSIFIFVNTFILSTTSYKHVLSTVLFIGCLVAIVSLLLYIPFRFLLIFLVNLLAAGYCIAIVIFFAERNDIFLTSCLLSIFLFGWALFIQLRPPMRYI